jgi:hypothetical protein
MAYYGWLRPFLVGLVHALQDRPPSP